MGLAFFDPNVAATKCAMVKLMQREGENEPLKRIKLATRLVPDCRLEDFVTQNTRGLFVFDKLGIETETAFLEHDPESWSSNDDFPKGMEIVKNIKVTNDHVVQEFNKHITHDEDQLQFLLQVVSEHRRQFPDSKKSNFAASQS